MIYARRPRRTFLLNLDLEESSCYARLIHSRCKKSQTTDYIKYSASKNILALLCVVPETEIKQLKTLIMLSCATKNECLPILSSII